MYWLTGALYNTPVFSEMINRNRFYLIWKFIYFNNNKIQTIIQMTKIEFVYTRFVRLLT